MGRGALAPRERPAATSASVSSKLMATLATAPGDADRPGNSPARPGWRAAVPLSAAQAEALCARGQRGGRPCARSRAHEVTHRATRSARETRASAATRAGSKAALRRAGAVRRRTAQQWRRGWASSGKRTSDNRAPPEGARVTPTRVLNPRARAHALAGGRAAGGPYRDCPTWRGATVCASWPTWRAGPPCRPACGAARCRRPASGAGSCCGAPG
jgi:hypothetical protein